MGRAWVSGISVLLPSAAEHEHEGTNAWGTSGERVTPMFRPGLWWPAKNSEMSTRPVLFFIVRLVSRNAWQKKRDSFFLQACLVYMRTYQRFLYNYSKEHGYPESVILYRNHRTSTAL